MKKSQRLMWKMFIFLLAFCGLLLMILWLFETVFLDTMYKSIRKDEMEKAIALVEENINSPDLGQIVRDLADNREIIITLEQEFVPPDRTSPGGKPPIREAITVRKDFVTAEGRKLSLVFYAIISPVNATISTIKVQLAYVTGIMIVLSIILSFLMARTVAKPIEDLNRGAMLMAKGNYKNKFSGRGYREIKELSDTLNYAASELSKVEQLRRELMANISHDLRTPLALIYSHAELMHDFPEEINPDQTQLIMDVTRRLSNLVSDILDVSKLETGTMDLHVKHFNITELIRQSIDRMSKLVEKDGYTFTFEYDNDITVYADDIKIMQVFYNLLVNAIHYSKENLHIIIRQRELNNNLRIEVADNGEGIRSEDLPYIWDRYYKIEKNHKRAITGTGLGLAIVKKIIDLHKGSYGVETEYGCGSVFWFEILISSAT